jgi:elongation factor Ts
MLKFLKQPAQLICSISVRDFSSTFRNFQKPSSNLAKLRKTTGYALSKCKTALDKFDDNLEEATRWLNEEAQKEGWAKADKVKDRATSQGTLVLINDKALHRASIIEVFLL